MKLVLSLKFIYDYILNCVCHIILDSMWAFNDIQLYLSYQCIEIEGLTVELSRPELRLSFYVMELIPLRILPVRILPAVFMIHHY